MLSDGHIEIDLTVHKVGMVFSHVIIKTRGATARAGIAHGDGLLTAEGAGSLHSIKENTVSSQKTMRHFVDFDEPLAHILPAVFKIFGQVVFDPPDTPVTYGQSRAGDGFDQIPDQLARLNGIEKGAHCAELQRAGANGREVVTQPADFAN